MADTTERPALVFTVKPDPAAFEGEPQAELVRVHAFHPGRVDVEFLYPTGVKKVELSFSEMSTIGNAVRTLAETIADVHKRSERGAAAAADAGGTDRVGQQPESAGGVPPLGDQHRPQ